MADAAARTTPEDEHLERLKARRAQEAASKRAEAARDERFNAVRALVWRCGRNGFPNEQRPELWRLSTSVETSQFDWEDYASRWTREAIVPAADALVALCRAEGLDAVKMADIAPVVASVELGECIRVMSAPFTDLLGRGKNATVVPSVAKRLAKLLQGDPTWWTGYHSYFDSLHHKVERARMRQWPEESKPVTVLQDTAKPRSAKRRGRPQKYDPRADEALVAKWTAARETRMITRAEFEREQGLDSGRVRAAMDRVKARKLAGK